MSSRKYHIQLREADEGCDPAVILSIRESGEEIEALIWSQHNPYINIAEEVAHWEHGQLDER